MDLSAPYPDSGQTAQSIEPPRSSVIEPVDRPRTLFHRSGHVPTRLLYRFASRIGLAQFGPPKSLAAEIELGRAAVLLTAVALFDFFAWAMLIANMAEDTWYHTWLVSPVFALLFTTVTVMFEMHLLTQPSAFQLDWLFFWTWWKRPKIPASLFPYAVRVGMIFISALATSQPMETLMFSGSIKRRQHEESVVQFAVDVHQRLLFDETDMRNREQKAASAQRDARSKYFSNNGSGDEVGGLGDTASRDMKSAKAEKDTAERRLAAVSDLQSLNPGIHEGCPQPLNIGLCGGITPASTAEASGISAACASSFTAYRNSRGRQAVHDRLVGTIHARWSAYVDSACANPESAVYTEANCGKAKSIVDRSTAGRGLQGRGTCNKGAYTRLLEDSRAAAAAAVTNLGVLARQKDSDVQAQETKSQGFDASARDEGDKNQKELEAQAKSIAVTIAAMRQAIPTLLRSAPGTYYLCAPYGEVTQADCGDAGMLPGVLKPYAVKDYDFNEQLRVLRDLREGRPPRWPAMGPDAIGRLRSFGLAREYYGARPRMTPVSAAGSTPATELESLAAEALELGAEWKAAAERDGGALQITWILVFLGAFFIPFVVFTWKLSLSPSLQKYFNDHAHDA